MTCYLKPQHALVSCHGNILFPFTFIAYKYLKSKCTDIHVLVLVYKYQLKAHGKRGAMYISATVKQRNICALQNVTAMMNAKSLLFQYLASTTLFCVPSPNYMAFSKSLDMTLP